MTDKPILFSGEMVRAILDGRKTQTRRVINPQPVRGTVYHFDDLLWVRESWQAQNMAGQWWHEIKREERPLHHWAFTNPINPAFDTTPPRWLPSIHMPRLASRIELRATGVRVEQVQDISEVDAQAEGAAIECEYVGGYCNSTRCESQHYRKGFKKLWESINGPRGFGWDANPWVWVVSFELVR